MRFGEVLTTLTGLKPTRWIDFKVPQGLADVVVGDRVDIRDVNGALQERRESLLCRQRFLKAPAPMMSARR